MSAEEDVVHVAIEDEKQKQGLASMEDIQTQKRGELLQQPPFSSLQTLVDEYNQRWVEKKNVLFDAKDKPRVLTEHEKSLLTELNGQLETLGNVLKAVIESISRQEGASLQGRDLITTCENTEIVKAFFEKLLTEIGNAKQNFPMLYSTLGESVAKSDQGGDDYVQMSELLSDRLDTVHAADIQVSSQLLASLCQVLAKMLQSDKVHYMALKTHKATLEKALHEFDKRLAMVKKNREGLSREDQYILDNLLHGIKLAEYCVVNIKDERTPARRYVHHAKLAGGLLLEAGVAAGSIAAAVATFGAATPAAAVAVSHFAGHAIKEGRQLWRRNKANNATLKQALDWETHWLNAMEDAEGDAEKAAAKQSTLLQVLSTQSVAKKGRKIYTDKDFRWTISQRLLAFYPDCSEGIKASIFQVLTNYYETAKEGENFNDLLCQQIGRCLWTLSANNERLRKEIMDADEEGDKFLRQCDIDHFEKEISQLADAQKLFCTENSESIIKGIWRARYPDDMALLECLSQDKMNSRQTAISIRTLKDSHKGLSYWGKQVLATIPDAFVQAAIEAKGQDGRLAHTLIIEKDAVLRVAKYGTEKSVRMPQDATMSEDVKNLVVSQLATAPPDENKKSEMSDVQQWEGLLADVIKVIGSTMEVFYHYHRSQLIITKGDAENEKKPASSSFPGLGRR